MAGCNTSACRRTLTAESTRTERPAGSRLRSSATRPLKSYMLALTCTRPATAERREIMARRTMTPHGYNESSGGEYAGSRSDTLFSSDHLYRLSRAAVGVEHMDGATHEEEAGGLAASGVEAVMERYWEACSVVVELWRSGVYVGRIARRAGLGHGYIYGMLRDAGENPK